MTLHLPSFSTSVFLSSHSVPAFGRDASDNPRLRHRPRRCPRELLHPSSSRPSRNSMMSGSLLRGFLAVAAAIVSRKTLSWPTCALASARPMIGAATANAVPTNRRIVQSWFTDCDPSSQDESLIQIHRSSFLATFKSVRIVDGFHVRHNDGQV